MLADDHGQAKIPLQSLRDESESKLNYLMFEFSVIVRIVAINNSTNLSTFDSFVK